MKIDLDIFNDLLGQELKFISKMQVVLETDLKPEIEAVKRLMRFNDSMMQIYQDNQIEVK